ncbi:MAG TPA: DUF1015 domain-containing protein [Candidatus Acidoferrales bacterium]|nr:DUF1015 domain-containing protein [Candidatus Acidoferrales bacterium]
MPLVRPFRALRYSPEVVPDLGAVVAPPYDVIGPEEQQSLLARSPWNVVRLDLPPIVPGEDPDERYRRAARTLTEWRSDGTLRRDPRPSLYAYEQSFTLPGSETVHVRRGLFGRLVLEPFGPDSGVRPHERTLSGPKEDRYRLLRATGVNTSPVVVLYEDPSGAAARWLDDVTSAPSAADVTDDAGVRHRLWVAEPGDIADRVGAAPVTILDGHHRYETALRYRDERMHGAPPEAEPAWAQILALFLEPIAGPVAVLATHRVVRGLGDDGVRTLVDGASALFEVRRGVAADELGRIFSPAAGAPGGDGRFGLWTRQGGAILHARRPAFEGLLPAGGPAVRRLDVTLLGAALASLAGIDAAAVDAGQRIAYTKDAAEAIAWVDAGHDGADAAFLLDPTPAAEIAAVAADGDVMPQKSTYIYPKALTGLLINPLE